MVGFGKVEKMLRKVLVGQEYFEGEVLSEQSGVPTGSFRFPVTCYEVRGDNGESFRLAVDRNIGEFAMRPGNLVRGYSGRPQLITDGNVIYRRIKHSEITGRN